MCSKSNKLNVLYMIIVSQSEASSYDGEAFLRDFGPTTYSRTICFRTIIVLDHKQSGLIFYVKYTPGGYQECTLLQENIGTDPTPGPYGPGAWQYTILKTKKTLFFYKTMQLTYHSIVA